MSNADIQIFTNEQFGSVRTIGEGDTVLFCGSDVASALGYAAPRNAIATHCKGALKRCIPTNGGDQEMSFIPEGDVYRLIIRSNLPEAVRFEKWLFEEVLPSIRKHGGYLTEQKIDEILSDPDTIIRLATELKARNAQIKTLEAQKAILAPKAEFYDAVADSTDTLEMAAVAKILNVGIGRNRLINLLKDALVLRSNGTPYQKFVDNGWLRCIEEKYEKPDGSVFIYTKTVAYQKGVDGILKLLKEKYGLIPKIVA